MKFLGARPQHEDLKLLVEDSDAVENNLAKFDSSGNPVDSAITAANVSDAVDKKHTQNTDTGTTSSTFQLDSDSSGPKLKNSSGIVEIRNAGDTAYAHIRPNNIYPLGAAVPLFTTADVTYYVNPSTGSDDNNNGSSGSPFKTIAKAVSMIPQIVNHTVEINLADGSYSEGITLAGYIGKGTITITGNMTTPTNVVFSSRIYVTRSTCLIQLRGMETTYTGGDSISIERNPGAVFLDKLVATNSTSTYAALYVSYSPSVCIQNSTLSNHKYGIYAIGAARVFSYNNSGSNNTTGLCANGSTIMKGSTQPGGTTGEAIANGGVIR